MKVQQSLSTTDFEMEQGRLASKAQWNGLTRYIEVYLARIGKPAHAPIGTISSDEHPHYIRLLLPSLMARWKVVWSSQDQERAVKELTRLCRADANLGGLWRYSMGLRQLRPSDANEKAATRLAEFQRDPQGRFSIKYRTYDDWLAFRTPSVFDGVCEENGEEVERWSSGNIGLDKFQAISRYHFLYPDMTLYDLYTYLAEDLRASDWAYNVGYIPINFDGFNDWRREWERTRRQQETRTDAIRDYVQARYPRTPYWWIDDHWTSIMAGFHHWLVFAIEQETHRVWGTPRGLPPDNSVEPELAYLWLEDHYGITLDADIWWRKIRRNLEGSEMTDLLVRDHQQLRDTEGVLDFLERLLAQYRVRTETYVPISRADVMVRLNQLGGEQDYPVVAYWPGQTISGGEQAWGQVLAEAASEQLTFALLAVVDHGYDATIGGYFHVENQTWVCPVCAVRKHGWGLQATSSPGPLTAMHVSAPITADAYCGECNRWIPILYSGTREHTLPHLTVTTAFLESDGLQDDDLCWSFRDLLDIEWIVFKDSYDPLGCDCCGRPLIEPGLVSADIEHDDGPQHFCGECVADWKSFVLPRLESMNP